jgi:hypothetical protein
MNKIKEKVIYRLKPCTCGCKGQDPWHRMEYLRVIKLESPTQGTVRLPMSSKPVTVRKSDLTGLWLVDRDSIVFDRG